MWVGTITKMMPAVSFCVLVWWGAPGLGGSTLVGRLIPCMFVGVLLECVSVAVWLPRRACYNMCCYGGVGKWGLAFFGDAGKRVALGG